MVMYWNKTYMNMKKICLFIMVLLGLASCSDQLTVSEKENVVQPATQVDDEYHYYLEKARWGEAGAYVKLADFYREGKYVNSDFMGMTAMLAMAEQYDRNHRLKDYIKALPEDDSYRMMFEAMDKIGKEDRGKVKDVASVLVSNGKPEGYVINGAIQVEEGDTIGGLETIRYGAEQGSAFGELILCMAPAFLGKSQRPYNAEGLISLADKFPFANKFLAEMYAGEVCDSVYDPEQAARYFLKADEHGFLGRRGAKWLLDYYARENIQIDELEKQRLVALSGVQENETVVTEDIPIIHQEQSIQEYVDSVARYRMLTDGCKRAIVYVVETESGRVIARSSSEDTGNYVVPFEDTFNRENDYMHGVATYLAVQWTGNLLPNTKIDTGSGVYESRDGKLIKDHNWRRGGYGEMTLEDALTHRSEVGLAKAVEQAYGDDRQAYEHQISFYMNEQPDNLMGMLTFYNAIANGGRMVKICGPEDDVTVIHDQICYPEYIKPVQRAMERCVSEGIYKRARNEYIDVAACGRTLRFQDNSFRMELCGYFPAKSPQYTIMVVMEKDGLPASAGGMCGPLFSQIVDGLLLP